MKSYMSPAAGLEVVDACLVWSAAGRAAAMLFPALSDELLFDLRTEFDSNSLQIAYGPRGWLRTPGVLL